jgi:hypothetical protein
MYRKSVIKPFHTFINTFAEYAFLFFFRLLFHFRISRRVSAVRVIILTSVYLNCYHHKRKQSNSKSNSADISLAKYYYRTINGNTQHNQQKYIIIVPPPNFSAAADINIRRKKHIDTAPNRTRRWHIAKQMTQITNNESDIKRYVSFAIFEKSDFLSSYFGKSVTNKHYQCYY